MNWTGIITFLAIITGIYFLWSWLSQREANPTTQEAFSLSRETPILETAPVVVANELPETVPEKSVTYDTVYNIVVEAPVIPDLNTGEIIEDILEDIEVIQNDPLSDATGGADKLDNSLVPLGKIIPDPAPIRIKARSVAPVPAPYVAPKTEVIAVAKEITTTAPSSGIAILDKIAWGM